jgi:hypothetical protein
MGVARSTHEMRKAYKLLVGKPEWNRPLGRPRHRWEDKKYSVKVWTGFIWLRIRISGGILRIL